MSALKVCLYSSAAVFIFAFTMQFMLLWDYNKAGLARSVWIVPIRMREWVKNAETLRWLRIWRALMVLSFCTLLACFAVSIVASVRSRTSHSRSTGAQQQDQLNTYRPKPGCFADHTEKVIDLLKRVTTVSVRTQSVIEQMKGAQE